MNRYAIALSLFVSSFLWLSAHAQEFELAVPNSDVVSQAQLSDDELRIVDAQGVETVYLRKPRYDSSDANYVGYYSASAQRVIRWPVSNRGRLLIASVEPNQALQFRQSRMEIRAIGPAPGGGGKNPGGPIILQPQIAYRLTSIAAEAENLTLDVTAAGDVEMDRIADDDSQFWHLAAVGNGLFRIHSDTRGRRWSLAATADRRVHLERTDDGIKQFWEVISSPNDPGSFLIINAAANLHNLALTGTRSGVVGLKPRKYQDTQAWHLVAGADREPPVFEEYRSISREIRPNEPLPPANLELANSHAKELWVLLVDRLHPEKPQRLKIPVDNAETISLERDAGGTLVETYERVLSNGAVEREEYVTPLPPAVRYDLSVYELIAQSVAIDRTKPGGKIEDVQYAPRSLGWFELPPGPELQDETIDLYERAKEAENPGQVRRLDLKQWQPTSADADPVESVLDEINNKP